MPEIKILTEAELHGLISLDLEAVACVENAFDPRFATRAALLAQPGVTAADADAFLAARAGNRGAEPPQGPALCPESGQSLHNHREGPLG